MSHKIHCGAHTHVYRGVIKHCACVCGTHASRFSSKAQSETLGNAFIIKLIH